MGVVSSALFGTPAASPGGQGANLTATAAAANAGKAPTIANNPITDLFGTISRRASARYGATGTGTATPALTNDSSKNLVSLLGGGG